MGDGPAWLRIAQKEHLDHVSEEPGPRNNPRILQYHAATTLHAEADEVPWCSSFVNWCMACAGVDGTKSAAAVSWLQWGTPLDRPRLGCIVVLRRGNNPALGHVGFYVGEESNRIAVLGGNQSDCVCVKFFPKAEVRGYRWPRVKDFRESETKEGESRGAEAAAS